MRFLSVIIGVLIFSSILFLSISFINSAHVKNNSALKEGCFYETMEYEEEKPGSAKEIVLPDIICRFTVKDEWPLYTLLIRPERTYDGDLEVGVESVVIISQAKNRSQLQIEKLDMRNYGINYIIPAYRSKPEGNYQYITFEDANFDGYKDIKIFDPGVCGTAGCIDNFWLFDKNKNNFFLAKSWEIWGKET